MFNKKNWLILVVSVIVASFIGTHLSLLFWSQTHPQPLTSSISIVTKEEEPKMTVEKAVALIKDEYPDAYIDEKTGVTVHGFFSGTAKEGDTIVAEYHSYLVQALGLSKEQMLFTPLREKGTDFCKEKNFAIDHSFEGVGKIFIQTKR
jgi:hypothetical protein